MGFPLPDELIGLILNHLDVPSLLRCIQVCKLFHSVISESIQLVYKIELFASCMVDNERSSMDTVSRLNVLREHNRVWNDMKWASYGSIPKCDPGYWEFSGGILAQSTRQDEIFLVQLPCKLMGIAERRWSIPFDLRIRDFTLDSSQDLIVLLEAAGTFPNNSCVFHLRTLSGENHPRTVVPQITYAPGNSRTSFSFVMQICGNRLAVLLHDRIDSQNYFLVWNWQTGHREMHIHAPGFESFAFMTDDLVLAAILKSDREPTLQVLRMAEHVNPIHSLEDMPCVCELQYPELEGHTQYFLIRSDPSPASRPPANSGVPFYCSRKDSIFTITMTIYSDLDGKHKNIVLFVPLSTLLSEVGRSHNIPRRNVAWDTWGPSGTRMISREPSDVWVCYTYGMKFIQGPQRNKEHLARVYDFNPYAAKMHGVKTSVDSPSLWKPLPKQSKPSPRCEGFDREFTTTLPGRVASVTLHHPEECWEAVMIGENHILMVQSMSSTYGYMAM